MSGYIAVAIILSNTILFFIYLYASGPNLIVQANWFAFIIFQLIFIVVIFFLVQILLEQFVFRKIKLIYKIISESKLKSDAEIQFMDPRQTTLNTVNEEVLGWAKSTSDQIQYLKMLEEYRKKYVGDISHELKTPIFTIQGYILTLLDGGLYDESINRKYLERAAKNVERIQIIVDDLEMINKLESGKLHLDLQKFDIKQLVDEVFMDLNGVAKEKKVTLHYKKDANRNFMVNADKEYIRQVITNLIVNSIKYGKDGGNTQVSFYDLDEKVLIEVSDDGIGIDEEHKKHLFDRFYRVDASRSRQQGGSGLGLSIVKHIIEAHQQNINIRSTIDIGSTFGFTLEKPN